MFKRLATLTLVGGLFVAMSSTALANVNVNGNSSAGSKIPDQVKAKLDRKDAKGDIFIDASVSASDKEKLSKVMATLDKEDRENVLFIDQDGSVIANKPQLVEEFKKQNKDKFDSSGKLKIKDDKPIKEEKPDDSCKIDATTLLSLASTGWKNAESNCGTTDRTGPYRRVISDKGYSRLHSYIYVPSKASGLYINPNSTKGDTAYIYTGATDKDGDSVDIGLQYNNPTGNNYPWDNTWAIFLRGASNVSVPTYSNFQPAQWVLMKFYVPSDNSVALNVTGYDSSGVMRSSTITGTLGWTKDFRADGTGMNIKKVTSIAQISPDDLTTGSQLGSKTTPVRWENGSIGKGNDANSVAPMTIGWFCGYNTNNVLVDFTDHNNEAIIVGTMTFTP
ncbi:hypothetical protein LJK88_06490 [Paenibacillus sp. P26]|nr:hypothetical protein LJK88_06490 [Paenibacillus sp. P26]UUZ90355.1 hypothetical protein LJK87_31035 [Paenibacillus sp. P25]